MKERPIIFSAPMVRAILAGQKTMTRRLMNPQPVKAGHNSPWCWLRTAWCDGGALISDRAPVDFCPYGQPGDRLWVREAFIPSYWSSGSVAYRADWTRDAEEVVQEPRWRPSIHMPRWASRLTLEVTATRVERLKHITESDALAEGVDVQDGNCCAVGAFEELWGDIHGEGSWALNPWVWVVSFERVKGGAS